MLIAPCACHDAGLLGDSGESNPAARPRRVTRLKGVSRLLRPPLGPSAFATFPLFSQEQGLPALRVHYFKKALLYEIHCPVGLLDGGVQFSALSGELVHLAPLGRNIHGCQNPDLVSPVARDALPGRPHQPL